MKFPRKLSKERLSLLSPEDRKIYEYEHSGLCPEMKKLQESKKKKVVYNDEGKVVPDICPKCGGAVVLKIQGEPIYVCSNCDEYYGTMPCHLGESEDTTIDNDDEITYEDIQDMKLSNEYSEEEKRQIKQMMDEMLFESQFDELFDKELIAEVGLDEYNNIKKNIFEYVMNDPDLHSLNEAEGHSADWWMDCSWILKLSAGLLTGLLGIIAWLFMKGKDRLAMMKLKQYMNKLVELTDSGVNKKRPWYSFLLPGRKNKQNTGDYNKACFRTIQETAERNMACLYTQCIHRLGFLSPSLTNFNSITSGDEPTADSGLGQFFEIVNGVSTEGESSYINEGTKKLLPIKINEKRFNKSLLMLPSLPTNYAMLMSNIDYPTKANENPNGSLFMKPTKEIIQDKASDIGLKYFNKEHVKLDDIVKYETLKNESYFTSLNTTLSLFEVENENGLDKTKGVSFGGPLTGDLDSTTVLGRDLDQETKKRVENKASAFNGNLIDAIDNYVRGSIPIVTSLMKSICGNNGMQEMSKFAQKVADMNNASEGNMDKYMKKEDAVLKQIMDNEYQKDLNGWREFSETASRCSYIISWASSNEFKQKIGITDIKRLNEFIKRLQDKIRNSDSRNKDLDLIISKYTSYSKYDELKKIAYSLKLVDESISIFTYNDMYSYAYNSLFENELIKNGDEILSQLEKGNEQTYKFINANLTREITAIITSYGNPEDWYIIKNARERMKKLKDAADKEITEKIGLICRTSQSASSTLGDKFKAALSKHPVRATSLQNIWARYADDLDDRIESRIRSITGANGNSNIYKSIEEFLTVQYPNLIAVMLYYKQIFYLIKLYTDKYPITKESSDELKKQQEERETLYTYAQLLNILNSSKNNQN